MARSKSYHSLTSMLLILLWITLETTEASPLSRTATHWQKRAIHEDSLDRIDTPIAARVLPAPTTDESPTRKRDVVISNPTSTLTVGGGGGGVTINNGGGTTSGEVKESGGLTTANKITIGLAIPGAIAGIVTLILAWRKWKDRRQKKAQANGAMIEPSVGAEPKAQFVGYGHSGAVQESRWARRY